MIESIIHKELEEAEILEIMPEYITTTQSKHNLDFFIKRGEFLKTLVTEDYLKSHF